MDTTKMIYYVRTKSIQFSSFKVNAVNVEDAIEKWYNGNYDSEVVDINIVEEIITEVQDKYGKIVKRIEIK